MQIRQKYPRQKQPGLSCGTMPHTAGDITVTSGHLPENDYEVLVPVSMAEGTSIGRQIDASVNGQKLTVTGYYEDNDASGKESTDFYLVNENTIKYDMITDSGPLT